MAKSLRSKWKRKMRAIKREKMDEKVLIRLKKMLANAEAEQKIDMEESGRKLAEQKKIEAEKKALEPIDMVEVNGSEPSSPAMEVEGQAEGEDGQKGKKKRKASLKSMKNEDGRYPAWMTTKKIRRHARIQKKKQKRTTKEAKMTRNWKLANSL